MNERKRKIEDAIRFARASIALEGLTPSAKSEAEIRAQLEPFRGSVHLAPS